MISLRKLGRTLMRLLTFQLFLKQILSLRVLIVLAHRSMVTQTLRMMLDSLVMLMSIVLWLWIKKRSLQNFLWNSLSNKSFKISSLSTMSILSTPLLLLHQRAGWQNLLHLINKSLKLASRSMVLIWKLISNSSSVERSNEILLAPKSGRLLWLRVLPKS